MERVTQPDSLTAEPHAEHVGPRLTLADEFFLSMLDPSTGQPRLNATALKYGLSAARLGELLLSRHISLTGPTAVVAPSLRTTGTQDPPEDELSRDLLGRITREEKHHPVRVWLVVLNLEVPHVVAERLAAAGHLTIHEQRRLVSRVDVYLPTNRSTPADPAAHLRHSLLQRRVDEQHLALLVLADATRTLGLILQDMPQVVHEYARLLLRRMSTQAPQLAALGAQTDAAIGNVVAKR